MLRFRFFFTFFFSPMSWGTRQLFNTENGVGHQPVILGMGCCFRFGINYWDAEGISMMSQMTEMNQTAATVFLLQLIWDYFFTSTLVNNKILKDAVCY